MLKNENGIEGGNYNDARLRSGAITRGSTFSSDEDMLEVNKHSGSHNAGNNVYVNHHNVRLDDALSHCEYNCQIKVLRFFLQSLHFLNTAISQQ